MKRMTLMFVLIACGGPENLEPADTLVTAGSAPVSPAAVAPACVEQPMPRCQCCWPERYHGPNRCRFVRAYCAPVDPCESDPEQVCAENRKDGGTNF